MIPKIIIQTGRSRSSLSMVERASRASLAALNPDFECMFFDDAEVNNFVDTHFPQYSALFRAFPYKIQKFDFFRYLAVYHHGGFYFDLDILPARPLADLCQHDCVFSFEELTLHDYLRNNFGMDWEVANYAFAAAPRHPFMKAVIDNVVRAQENPQWPAQMWDSIPSMFREPFYVLDTTGPGLVSRTLAEFPGASGVHVLFPPDVCDESYWHHFGDYCTHLQGGGWRNRKSFLRRKLTSMWESRARAASMEAARQRGPARTLTFARPAV
jgi:inositol phosphorylceramide mannosyltransferase catalytic subunit